MPAEDDAFGRGGMRTDGRAMHDFYLFQVKTPAESQGEWGLYKLTATIQASDAFRPLAEGGCPFAK